MHRFRINLYQSMPSTPSISVVIISGTRKDFIIEAINSVLNQTLNKENYEILVVISFIDDKLEQEILSLGCRIVSTDFTSIGKLYSEGIKNSRYDVLSFLEDDDTFSSSKLLAVSTAFGNPRVVYYQHDSISFGDVNPFSRMIYKGVPEGYISLDIKMNRPILHSNMSCISIRKSRFFHFLNNLECINLTPDTFFFVLALELNGKDKHNSLIMSDKSMLANVRVHKSLSRGHILNGIVNESPLVRFPHELPEMRDYQAILQLTQWELLQKYINLIVYVRLSLYSLVDPRYFVPNSRLIGLLFTNLRYRTFGIITYFVAFAVLIENSISIARPFIRSIVRTLLY